MNWDWQKELEDKQRKEFFTWLERWYEIHKKNPLKMIVKLKYEYNNLEEEDQAVVYAVPCGIRSKSRLLLINEKLGINEAFLNGEFDTLKGFLEIDSNSEVVRLIVFMCILNNDWNNRYEYKKWFFNRFELKEQFEKPILTLSEILRKWKYIQNFFWGIRFDFLVLEDFLLSTLLPYKHEASYNLIPPIWFKNIPIRNKITPIVYNSTPSKGWQRKIAILKKREIDPENVHIMPIDVRIINQQREELRKKYFTQVVEALKTNFPSKYDMIKEMVDRGESLEVIKQQVISEKRSNSSEDYSEEQIKDYADYKYLCHDKVYIPGTIPMWRSNLIVVNGIEIKIGGSLFILFFRLVVELKKKKGGWVNIYTLKEERVIPDSGKYQIYSNLRTELKGSLLDRNGKNFIQNDGSKNYRISTHPDFITYNKKKLLNHPDHRIRELAEKLT